MIQIDCSMIFPDGLSWFNHQLYRKGWKNHVMIYLHENSYTSSIHGSVNIPPTSGMFRGPFRPASEAPESPWVKHLVEQLPQLQHLVEQLLEQGPCVLVVAVAFLGFFQRSGVTFPKGSGGFDRPPKKRFENRRRHGILKKNDVYMFCFFFEWCSKLSFMRFFLDQLFSERWHVCHV